MIEYGSIHKKKQESHMVERWLFKIKINNKSGKNITVLKLRINFCILPSF